MKCHIFFFFFPVACGKSYNQNVRVTNFLLGKSLLCLHAQKVFQFSVTQRPWYVVEVKEIKVIFAPSDTNTAVSPFTS